MVNFVKRARNTGDMEPDEDVVAASNVTPSQFVVANAGLTGGLIGGGAVGGAVGAAWDSRQRKKDAREGAAKSTPDVAAREPFGTRVPANGALLAVTSKRLVAWKISAMGKPKTVLLSVPFGDIDEVVWQDSDAKWSAGKPGSLLIWVGVVDRVLTMAGIAMGPGGKHIRDVIEALDQRLPGRVNRWTG